MTVACIHVTCYLNLLPMYFIILDTTTAVPGVTTTPSLGETTTTSKLYTFDFCPKDLATIFVQLQYLHTIIMK